MTGGKKIVGIWRDQNAASQEGAESGSAMDVAPSPSVTGPETWNPPLPDSFEPLIDAAPSDDEAVAPAPRMMDRWATPLLLIVALLWSGFAVWQATDGLVSGIATDSIANLVVTIGVPLAVLGIIWLGIQRSSVAEIGRYARATADLRRESEALAGQMVALTAHLRDAQAQLADQSATISQFGLETAARLHDSAASLTASMGQCVSASEQVAGNGENARRQIDGLLAGLPKVDAVAQRMADNIRHAGLVAHQHGANLEAQLAAVTEQGAGAAHMAEQAIARLHDVIAQTKTDSVAARGNLQQLGADLQSLSAATVSGNAKALDDLQARSHSMMGVMQSGLERHAARISALVSDAIGALATGIGAADRSVEAMGVMLDSNAQKATGLREAVNIDLDGFAARFTAMEQQSDAVLNRLVTSIASLDSELARFAPHLASGTAGATDLIAHSETLLLSLDSIARELDETLPRAFARMDERASQSEAVLAALTLSMEQGELVAESTLSRLQQAFALVEKQQIALQAAGQASQIVLNQQAGTAAELEERLRNFGSEADAFAASSGPKMVASLLQVRETAHQAATRARDALADVIAESSGAMQAASAAALSDGMKQSVQAQLDAITEASERAVAVAGAATDRLMRQMITIMDTSSAIEARVAEAETALAKADNDGMARRVSLLTESLKSAAIDVSKFLSVDVSDTAWESYLKGDRGVFTRRAVKLVENSDSKEILRHYEQDSDFRAHVNQYIHDFESMLRNIMGTRDGSALSITLLSSDVGKLYVALAQAIDRLRN